MQGAIFRQGAEYVQRVCRGTGHIMPTACLPIMPTPQAALQVAVIPNNPAAAPAPVSGNAGSAPVSKVSVDQALDQARGSAAGKRVSIG